MLKVMNFYLLLRILVKIYTVNMFKSFLIRQKNLLQMLLRLHQKDNSKTAKATAYLIGDNIADIITRIASDKPNSAAGFMLMELNNQ